MEIWKDVVGFEGIYQVSNLGRVKRIKQSAGAKAGRVLKETLGRKGYVYLKLRKEGRRKRLSLSRLVAQAFIPNPENKPEVNHKNGIKAFNWPENLEWVTHSENHLHRSRILGVGIGEKHGRAKLKNKDIPIIRRLLREGHLFQREIGEMFGVGRTTVSAINNKRNWAHI